MKNELKNALKSYENWKVADLDWKACRKTLEESLKQYAKRKSIEFSEKHNLTKYHRHDELFLINLDGGSSSYNWEPQGGFLGDLMLSSKEPGTETVWYTPTDKGTWLEIQMPDYSRIAKEIPGDKGPVDLKLLETLAEEMTKETGLLFYLDKQSLEKKELCMEFEKVLLLDGTVVFAEEPDEYEGGIK